MLILNLFVCFLVRGNSFSVASPFLCSVLNPVFN